MAKQKHNPKSRHHKRIVGGILAAALALTVVIAAQIGNTDTNLFKTDMASDCAAAGGSWSASTNFCQMPSGGGGGTNNCGAGYWWNGTSCQVSDSGGSTTTQMIYCPDGSSHTSPYTCPTTSTTPTCSSTQHLEGNVCVNNTTTSTTCGSGQYWNGTSCVNNTTTSTTCGSGQYWNGTACVSSTTTATTCSGGQYWNGTTCVSSTTGTACPSGQWWDSYSNSCKSSTATSGYSGTTSGGAAYPAGTCMNGTSYPAGYGYPPCGTATSGYTADTVGACQGRGGVWTASSSTCSIAPGTATYSGGYSGASGTSGSWPTKQIIWNTLGLQSMVCDNAPQAEIDARKLIVKDVSNSNVYWPNGTDCSRTDQRAGFPEKGTSTTTQPYTQPVGTVDNCTRNGGTWNASSSTCTYGNYMNSGYSGMTSGYNNYSDPVSGCTNAGGTWMADSGTAGGNSGWCDMKNASGMKQPYNTYGSGMQYPPMPTSAMNCGPDSYYDFGRNSCQPMQKPTWENFQGNFQYDANACFPGDPLCGKFDQGNFMDGQFDTQNFFNLDQAQCLNSRDAKRTLGMRKKELKDFDRELKSMDLSTLNDSPTIIAAVASIEDAKGIAQEMEANPSSTDYGCLAGKLDSIVGQLHSPEVGFWDAINQLRQVSDFKAQLGNIGWELDEINQRRAGMDIGEEDDAKLTAITDAALAKIAELEANPPYDQYDPQAMWDSLEPECMKFGGPMPMGPRFGGGGFGGGQGFDGGDFGGQGFGGPMPGPFRPCSYDEAIESDTPRGYVEAARIVLDDSQRNQFQDNICEDAAGHIDEFRQMIEENSDQLDAKDSAEAKRWFADAEKTLAVCNSAKDKFQVMPMFEGLKNRAGKLAARLGFADEFDAGSREFNGSKYLMSQNTLTNIDDLQKFIEQKINEEVNKRVAEIYDKVKAVLADQMTLLAKAGISDDVISGFTNILNTLVTVEGNEDVVDGVNRAIEYGAVLADADADRTAAVQSQQEALVANFEGLSTLESVDPALEDVVTEARAVLADSLYTPERLEQFQEVVDNAVNFAKNGGDTEEIVTIIEEGAKEALVASEDPVENAEILTKEAYDAGYIAHSDISDTAVWYALPATEAGFRFDLGTKTEEGDNLARPTVGLNVAEGLTMAAKSSGVEPNEDVTPEVKAIVGNIAWAGPYFQGMVDAGVPVADLRDKVRSDGGMGGSMERGEAVDAYILLMEAKGVDLPEIDSEAEIGHYEDFDRLSAAQKDDLALAHYYGISTGTNGGTSADANAPIDRAQMFTMAVRDFHALEGEGVLGGAVAGESFSSTEGFPEPTGTFVEEIPSI